MAEQSHPSKDRIDVRASFKPIELTRCFFGQPNIIGIYACYKRGGHILETVRGCCARSGISLLFDHHPGAVATCDLRRPICRTIVYHNDHCRGRSLRQHRFNRGSERPLGIKSGDDDTILRHCWTERSISCITDRPFRCKTRDLHCQVLREENIERIIAPRSPAACNRLSEGGKRTSLF